MKFGESGTDGESAEKDELLSMDVVPENSKNDLLVVTSKGFAKRTALNEYRVQKRGGYGVKVMNVTEGKGNLVGAVVVEEDDQIMAVMKSGKVIRSDVSEIKLTGRYTQGVTLVKPGKNDSVISIARNAEKDNLENENAAENSAGNSLPESGEQVSSENADSVTDINGSSGNGQE